MEATSPCIYGNSLRPQLKWKTGGWSHSSPAFAHAIPIHLKHILSYLFIYLLNKLNSSPKAHLDFYILQEVLPDAPR